MMRSVMWILVFLVVVSSVLAIKDMFSLQGKVELNGALVDDGNVTVLIYSAPTGGSPIYNSTNDYNNSIQNGFFDIMLGSTTSELDLVMNGMYYMDLLINGNDLDWGSDERRQFQSPVGNITNLGDSVFIGTTVGSRELNINSSDDTYIDIRSGTTTTRAGILFGDSGNSGVGQIVYNNSVDGFYFVTSSNRVLDIDSSGNVGINDSTPDAQLEIAGSGHRFMVSSAPDQDGNIFIITENGSVGIGNTHPGTTRIINNLTDTQNISGRTMFSNTLILEPAGNYPASVTMQGITNSVRVSEISSVSPNFGKLQGIYTEVVNSANGSVTNMRGIESWMRSKNEVNITNVIGFLNQIEVDRGNVSKLVGTEIWVYGATPANVTDIMGIYINDVFGTAKGKNRYGIKMNAFNGGAPTDDDYGLYIATTQDNYFAGKVGIGTTSPRAKFQVESGNVQFEQLGFEGNWPQIGFNVLWNSSGNSEYVASDSAFVIHHDQSNDILEFMTAVAGTAGDAPSFTSNVLVLDTNGEVYVGTASDSGAYAFQVSGEICETTAGTAACASDMRLKENIKPLKDESGLQLILQFKPKEFNFIGDNKTVAGLIAQDIQEIRPDWIVQHDDDEYITFDDKGYIQNSLIQAIQEQQVMIQQLEQRIAELENN